MTRLQGGAHIEVFDGPLEANERDRANNRLEPASIQSDITPDPRVQCQIFGGNLPVPMSLPRFLGIIHYLEHPSEPLQPATLGG